ncbi:MAG TPA: GtrA family protein [Actinophytocola sp.]|uniref:GtrA family protein n=1 Tax=Actinophytocola sp. TaxID=1872138 RepID=UPI002DDCCDAE|nr:GtrA family protein [Actinophytocola sp.]HEV2778222.1 GtrA family protein [Actinophytocola sp.]
MAGFLDTLFRRRTNSFGVQLVRYLYVGGIAAIVDTGLVYLLAYRLDVHYLPAVGIAFVVGSAVNYAGCVRWIFELNRGHHRVIPEFLAVSGVGLLTHEGVVWLLYARVGVGLMAAKVVAVAVAMMWNFILRRVVVFR